MAATPDSLHRSPSGSGTRPFARLTYIVGHSRGGTTWLGQLFACHPDTRYLFEPFASQAYPCTGIDTQTVFNGGRFIRLRKAGYSVADIPVKRFFRQPTGDPNCHRLAALAAMHLAELTAQAFPGEHGYHLVVKQPRIENVAWATEAIGADHVVALDRHPFGVVNSVRRWGKLDWIKIEWEILESDPTIGATERSMIGDACAPEERLLVLSWLRSLHLRRFAAGRSAATLVEYESLCLNPVDHTVRMWLSTGLDASDQAIAALRHSLSARSSAADRRSMLRDTHKDPLSRVHAWRSELPDSIRRRLESFVRRHALPIPLPGAGLPELTGGELWSSRQADLLALGAQCRRIAKAIVTRGRLHRD